MNRKERRAGAAIHRRNLKTAEFDDWVDITYEFIGKIASHGRKTEHILFFKKNSRYSVQAYQSETYILAGIRRHDQSTDVSWASKQRIKNELFGEEKTAIEFFPPKSALIDDANIYWIWIPVDNYKFSANELTDVISGKYFKSKN